MMLRLVCSLLVLPITLAYLIAVLIGLLMLLTGSAGLTGYERLLIVGWLLIASLGLASLWWLLTSDNHRPMPVWVGCGLIIGTLFLCLNNVLLIGLEHRPSYDPLYKWLFLVSMDLGPLLTFYWFFQRRKAD